MTQWRRDRTIWRHLRRRQLGVRFRRQEPIAGYIVDFVCVDRRLIVEIDGETHIDAQADAVRNASLARRGFTTLRFWNDEVYGAPGDVVDIIARAIDSS